MGSIKIDIVVLLKLDFSFHRKMLWDMKETYFVSLRFRRTDEKRIVLS